MGVGSFLAGLFLGKGSSSSTTVHKHNTIIIRNPIQYPNDWDNYTDEGKLEWLKNRSYWHEYYKLKNSLYQQAEFKLVEGGDDIYSKVINSIIENRGDETEAKQLFSEYLNERFAGKVLNETTRMEFKMEIDRMKNYIQHNYSLISQFYESKDGFEVWLKFKEIENDRRS